MLLSSSSKSLKPPRGLGDYVDVAPRPSVATPLVPEPPGPLRFISASASRQHPNKRDAGYVYADAVARAPRLLGVCDGVSGVQQLGLKPDELPRQLLEECSKAMDHCIAAGEVPCNGDGHWLMNLLQDAYDRTVAWGATTVLLAAMEDSRRLVVANVGDCGLLVLRPDPSCPSVLSREFRTDALRYEANRPVQVMRLANTIAAETHLVIQGARVNTVSCNRGDIVILGSDGIFDNLQDEEIALIVERHVATPGAFGLHTRPSALAACTGAARLPTGAPAPLTGDMATAEPQREHKMPTFKQLERVAAALVEAAIRNVRTEALEDAEEEQYWEASRQERPGGNADDTTAIVAVVVEAEDLVTAELEDPSQAARQTFRVGSRQRPLASIPGDEGHSATSWAAGGLLGFGGFIPQCCSTSADRGEEFEEYLLCREPRKPAGKEQEAEKPEEPEQCAIS